MTFCGQCGHNLGVLDPNFCPGCGTKREQPVSKTPSFTEAELDAVIRQAEMGAKKEFTRGSFKDHGLNK